MNSNLNISEMYEIAPYTTQRSVKQSVDMTNNHSAQPYGRQGSMENMQNMNKMWDTHITDDMSDYTDHQILGDSMLSTRNPMQSNIPMVYGDTTYRNMNPNIGMNNMSSSQNTGFTNPGNYGLSNQPMQNINAFTGSSQNMPMYMPKNNQGYMMSLINNGVPMEMSIERHSLEELNGYLRTCIGKRIEAEFLMDSGRFIVKKGILNAVGSNYILLSEENSNDIIACDFNQIKFVRFIS